MKLNLYGQWDLFEYRTHLTLWGRQLLANIRLQEVKISLTNSVSLLKLLQCFFHILDHLLPATPRLCMVGDCWTTEGEAAVMNQPLANPISSWENVDHKEGDAMPKRASTSIKKVIYGWPRLLWKEMPDLHQSQTGQSSCPVHSGGWNAGDVWRLSTRTSKAAEIRS